MAIPEHEQGKSGRPLSIRAFADLAETSPRRVRRLIRQGRLRTVENNAGETRIPEGELERMEAQKQNRALKQSMELQAVTTEVAFEEGPEAEMHGPIVPLQRHEAAMVRLGFLESEIATTRQMLQELAQREAEFKERADAAEKDAISATVRAVEAEHQLEEMRTQVIDSTFRAMELQQELEEVRKQAMLPWWKRLFGSARSEEEEEEAPRRSIPPGPTSGQAT